MRDSVRRLLLILALLACAPLQAQQPAITSVVNAASYAAGAVVPGGIATLFGTGIVSASGILEAAAVPLPTTLGGTQVLVNNIPAPLFAVANVNRQEQINFQVPWEVAGMNTVTVVVVNGSARSAPRDYTVRAADPGLFTLDGVSAIVVHGATNQLVTAANPPEPGEVVVFYATGLGAVDRAQQSGQPASLTELAQASNALTVTIGGRAAAVQFAGLTPGSIGLYQVNCTVPAGVSGLLEVQMTMLGQSSKPAKAALRGGIAGPIAELFGIEFVQIQPGEFTMGCSPGDGECYVQESPAHRVRITKAFQIGKYEVTQEQWQAVMGANPSSFKGAALPVEMVFWDDIQLFLQRLNDRNDGFRYRLPTEAEWEYAARAGTVDKYGGAGVVGDVAWYDSNSGSQTHPVGQKQPNAWGLYDMLGNVWEWCQDWYGYSYYFGSPQEDPAGPSSGTYRILRGGSFGINARYARVSFRDGDDPGHAWGDTGFRCVREVAESSSCASPAIITQPAGRTFAFGATADLTVTASGSVPLSYQWYEGAQGTTTKPVGTNSATFRTPALTAATTYWVRVTNACGQVDSAAATVSVTASTLLNDFGMEFVQIQPGEFTMGCSPGDSECWEWESPAHPVRITRGFQIGKYEVTQEQWQAVMGSNPSYYFKGATLPVEMVSWDDIQGFLRRLNARNDGFLYRLPTEAEWEYAARAGTTDKYVGASELGEIAWYEANSGNRMQPVGQKQSNAWGLYDMLGNVWEWCQDWYGDYSSGAVDNPTGPSSGQARILRGSSWDNPARYARVSGRNSDEPRYRGSTYGFRCVREEAASSCAGPAIVTQPAGQTIAAGSTADLTVTASGSAPLSYQWYEGASGNTTKPVGTNSPTFRTPALTPAATYWVRVTNACGQVDSAAATVSVTAPSLPTDSGTDFVQIQPGEFTMGCSPGDSECYPAESPAHRVRITRGFQIGKYEVTQEQWQAVMGSNPSRFQGATLPVEQVSWDDVQGFLQRLSGRNDGFRYRLPTEAEWEYAARAGTTDKYVGAGALGDVAWYRDNSLAQTHPVGQKLANAWGLFDMLGNVSEWCQDWSGDYSSTAADNPTGPSFGIGRALRGGSWTDVARGARVSIRSGYLPGTRYQYLGFRYVREMATSSCLYPAIVTQPAGQTIAGGSTAELTVTASGSAPLAYQWYEGAYGTTTKPVGTNSATFRTPALTVATTYWVRVTNACGPADSATATVSVTWPAGSDDMQFVQIQPGEFTMGCSPGDAECYSDESPAHRVRITKAFQIGRYEVTQQQWAVVMGSNPSDFKGVALPVETVSWDDAQQFLARLNARNDGFRYRLPTEAEWEYAARAGTADKYAGASTLGDVAWYDSNSGGQTRPVGQKQPNAWGVYDMLGNVQEWCQDWYDGSYYSSSPVENPAGPSSGQDRILRGGTWNRNARFARVSIRISDDPRYRVDYRGFRCVREAAACAGPAIVTQPAGQTVAGGSTAELTVTASGSAPLSYQWYEGARGTTTKPVGTNSSTFRTPALTPAATYWVRVTNACGQVDSDAATVSVAAPTLRNDLDMEFVPIQPGEFTMGCSPGDSQCMDDESPAHRVHITKAFQIGRYEVTQEQWAVVMGSSPSSFKGVALPVETVSWDDAQQFLARLNARNDGFRYRLPTEAEWEYAARAGTTDRYAGASTLGDVAWYGDNSGSTTHPVGQKRPNAWGVHDMLGNLQEWCQDWYGTSYYSSSPVENPAGPSSGQNRILRGGSFYGSARYVRVSIRVSNVPGYRHVSIGFRCVREPIP